MNEFAFRRTWGPEPRLTNVINYRHPHNNFVVIGGPCSVESKDQIRNLAFLVSKMGATHLRGGVFRAGTYPGKTFGWVDIELIRAFHSTAQLNHLKNIVEVLDYTPESLAQIAPYADCFQVGARSQQNYTLLRTLGSFNKPVFLKRHPGSTVDEWLGSAEHLLAGGVRELYLIERGSSTLHNDVRWTPCVHTIPSVKSICNIPVIMDASHGTGRSDLVEPLTLAGVAAGAGGILVEVHSDPKNSLSDKDQALNPKQFETLMSKVKLLRSLLG